MILTALPFQICFCFCACARVGRGFRRGTNFAVVLRQLFLFGRDDVRNPFGGGVDHIFSCRSAPLVEQAAPGALSHGGSCCPAAAPRHEHASDSEPPKSVMPCLQRIIIIARLLHISLLHAPTFSLALVALFFDHRTRSRACAADSISNAASV